MRTIRRRRMEKKTDYRSRLALLKSEEPRIVIRKTNRFVIVQLVKSDTAQDSIIVSANSKELLAKGWPKEMIGSLKSLPAAYLTGKLFASKASKHSKSAVLDMGMYRNVARSRIYAVLKGAVDNGMKIPHSADVLPKMEDFKRNEKTSSIFAKLNDSI